MKNQNMYISLTICVVYLGEEERLGEKKYIVLDLQIIIISLIMLF
jgi:hypothetical protein